MSDEQAMDIYLLMGQSNMSGRGHLSELSAADRTADSMIRLFGNDGQWRDALDPLDDASGQVDAVSADPMTAGVGPGLFFARAMRGKSGPQIGLVPCAKGGSKISAWARHAGRDTLYGSCLARARAAASAGRLAGILWYQGESDTKAPDVARTWTENFTAIILGLRSELRSPALPVALVSLADRPPQEAETARPFWYALQAAQNSLELDCARTVPAAGLPLRSDGLHLTTPAQRQLGSTLAAAMQQLRSSPACLDPELD